MMKNKAFPTTSKALRAATAPGHKTVSALLCKVDFPNDYEHVPDYPNEVDKDYFALSWSDGYGPPMESVHTPVFGDRSLGGNAARFRDAVPVDPAYPHIMTHEKFQPRKRFIDLYGWFADFWLISNRLRTVIEDLDPGSLECVKVGQDGFTVDQSYWACLSRRNLEAVDTTRSHVSFKHSNYGEPDGDPIWIQSILINRGAVFDSDVTNGVYHFWDVDLRRWFWSRELIAQAHQAGLKGPFFFEAGKPIGGEVSYIKLKEIYAEFSKRAGSRKA